MNKFQEEILREIEAYADNRASRSFESNPWREYDELNEIDENASYLVCYKNDVGQYVAVTKAYWVTSENAFFPSFGDWAFPLKVDLYMKIPEPRLL